MDAFCYRLIFRNGQFVSAHGTNTEGDLLALCQDESISKYFFGRDNWQVMCSQESHAPDKWKLNVEYKRPADEVPTYRTNHIVYGSGELFLCLTSNSRAISTFQYHDIQCTLFSSVGIHELSYRNITESARFLLEWTDFADDKPFHVSWIFTDGEANFSIQKHDTTVDVVSLDDPVLNGERNRDISVQVDQATWVVVAEVYRSSKTDDLTPSPVHAIHPPVCMLSVKDEAAAVSVIPRLHEYLAKHGCRTFGEFLYKRLP